MADQKLTALPEATSSNATDMFYIVTDSAGTPTSKHISRSNLIGYAQSSLGIPLVVGSGGSGISTVGSGSLLIGMNSSGVVHDYYNLKASDNLVITRVGTNILLSAITNAAGASSVQYAATGNTYVVTDFASDLTSEFRLVQSGNSTTINTAGNLIIINAITNDATLKQDLIAIPLIVTSGGTGKNVAGSGTTLVGINSSGVVYDFYNLLGSDNATVQRIGTAYYISGNSGVGAGRTLTASTGLSGGGDLSADRSFSVNTNIRDKFFGFFGAGNLSTNMFVEEARCFIPFNMEIRAIYVAATTAPTGTAVIVSAAQYNNIFTTSFPIVAAANRPQIAAGALVGSSLTFDIGTLYQGSWLGVNVEQVGNTNAGSNLTITLIARGS